MPSASVDVEAGSDGQQVKYEGRRLYSSRPHSGATARARRIDLPTEALCIVASPLLGYGVDVLTSRLPESSRLILLEANPELRKLTLEYCDTPVLSLQEARTWLHDTDDASLLQFRRVHLVSLNGGYALNARAYREYEDACRVRLQRAWQNKMTTIHMGRMWIANVIENLALLPTASDAGRLRTEKPVAVVGAGPSLDCTIDTLKALRDRLFVVCVDTAYRTLVVRGIRPDLVCIVEAQHANALDFVGVPRANLAVCAELSSHPPLLRTCRRLHLFSSTFGDAKLLDRLSQASLRPTALPPLGSVGVAALYLAGRMTEGPILTFGLDFAFLHGKTHARGTPKHLLDLRSMSRMTGSDPAPFTLSARVLATAAGLPLTTSELRTYNSVAVGISACVYDLGEAPRPLGTRIAPQDAGAVVETATCRRSRSGGTDPGFATGAELTERVRLLAEGEVESLSQMMRDLRAGRWQRVEDAMEGLAYVALDFPETNAVDPSSAPRLLSAAAFYRERWRRLIARLGRLSPHST